MRWARPCLGLLALVALVPAGHALPLDARLEVSGDVAFHGAATAAATWVGSVLDARLGPVGGPVELQVSGEAELVRYRYAIVERDPSNPTGAGHDAVLLDRVPEPLGRVDGPVRITQPDGHASVRLLPAGPIPWPVGNDFTVTLPRNLAAELRAGDPQPLEEQPGSYPPLGGVMDQADPPGPYDGVLLVSGWHVELPGQAVDTSRDTQGNAVPGLGLVGVQETRVLRVKGHIAPARGQGEAWLDVVGRVDGQLQGDLVLHNAQGTGSLNGTPLPAGLQMIQAVGDLQVAADYAKPSADWTLAGEPTFVAVNAGTLLGERWAWRAVEVAAAAGALAALLAWGGRSLLGAIPGLNLADPLANRQRNAILAMVADCPGIDQTELQKRSQVSRATVRHHLRILMKNDFLTERRIGKRATYTLNDGSYEFPATEASATSAAQAFAALRHPIRQAVYAELRGKPGLSVGDLRAAVGRAGLKAGASTLAYHLGILHRAGIVQPVDAAGQRWQSLFDAAGAAANQSGRLLSSLRLQPVWAALAQGPGTVDDVRRRLGARSGLNSRQVRSSLEFLVTIGYLWRQEDQFVRAPDRTFDAAATNAAA